MSANSPDENEILALKAEIEQLKKENQVLRAKIGLLKESGISMLSRNDKLERLKAREDLRTMIASGLFIIAVGMIILTLLN